MKIKFRRQSCWTRIITEKRSIARRESERERWVAEKKGTVRRQLPEKLISRGKEGAPAAWLSRTLPCSAGCRGARKRRMAMVRGAANGKPGETLFSKAIPSRFRRGTVVKKAKGARKGIRRTSRAKFPSTKKLVYIEIVPIAIALSSQSVRWDLIGLDRLTGLINRPITSIDEVPAFRQGSFFFGLFTPAALEGIPLFAVGRWPG